MYHPDTIEGAEQVVAVADLIAIAERLVRVETMAINRDMQIANLQAHQVKTDGKIDAIGVKVDDVLGALRTAKTVSSVSLKAVTLLWTVLAASAAYASTHLAWK